jgi:N-acetylneuraminic acid mutarotase
MKFLFLALLLCTSSYADFVFMHESEQGKSIRLQNGTEQTIINDVQNKMWALYPDVTPNGEEFVYAEGPDGNDLHLTYFNRRRGITYRFHHPRKGMVLHPKFTKNGQLIFFSAPAENGKNSVFFFDPHALAKRQGDFVIDYDLKATEVTTGEEAYFPRPSSDGSFVVYQRNSAGKKEIVLYNRVDDEKVVLAEGMSPALSFDENLIAYTSKKDGNWNVYVINRFTRKVSQMTSDAADEMAPSFDSKGSLAFASNKTGNFRIYQLDERKSWRSLSEDSDQEATHYSAQFTGEKEYRQKELAPYLGEARSSFGTVLHDGLLYMAGGHKGHEHNYPPESFTDDFLVYNPSTNEWKQLAPRPFKAHGYQIVARGNYIYALGGFAYSETHRPQWKSLDAIDRYDIKLNKWETIAKLNAPRSSNQAIMIGDKVYIIGGWDSTPQKENDVDGRFHDSIEIFDLTTEKIAIAPYKMPLPLRRAFTAVEYQGKIVMVGGLGVGGTHFELVKKVTALEPETGSVTEWKELPFATFAPAAGILNGELFVFGGMFKTGEMDYEYVAHVYGMDIKKQDWRHTGRYVQETKGFSQVFNLNEKTLGILGGHHYAEGDDTPVKTFETWSK